MLKRLRGIKEVYNVFEDNLSKKAASIGSPFCIALNFCLSSCLKSEIETVSF